VAKFKNLRKVFRAWKDCLPNLATIIKNCKQVLFFLDTLEEFRDLSIEEWNFRANLQIHLENTLNLQIIYWKQRGTIKWVRFRDECTRFFHANASIRLMQNFIMSLNDENGQAIFSHEGKADLIWKAFKERLGVSEFSHIYFNLEDLLTPLVGLDSLEIPFSKEEIDQIIADLPNNCDTLGD